MPGRQLLAGLEISLAGCEFGDDLAAMRDRDDAAGLLRALHLEIDPAAEIPDRVSDPRLHALPQSQILNGGRVGPGLALVCSESVQSLFKAQGWQGDVYHVGKSFHRSDPI